MRFRSLAVLSILPVVALACGGSATTDPTGAVGARSDAIYKGSPETASPAVMALQIDLGGGSGAACTGTVVAVKGNVGYYLTAAHCAVTHDANDEPTTTPLDPSQLYVLPGADYSKATTGYPVLEVKIHPAYKAITSAPYDFAMLRFSFTGAAPPVIPAMTPAEDTLAVGSKLDVIGYGKTDTNPNNSVRNHALLTISSFQSGGALVIFDGAQNTSGTCQGDSGGPGMSGAAAAKRVAAVTSFGGQSCGAFGGSGRVSKVYDSFIKPFIDGTTGALTCDECRSSATIAGGACAGQVDACLADPACKAYVDCSNACNEGDSACLTKCQTDSPPGAVFNTIFDCICKTGCPTECGSDDLCKAPSCGFSAQDKTCQTCFETKCCAEMSACANDKDCATCATSASPPASCATNALYQAEQSCISKGCFAECGGSKCGFGSDDATCNTCYEEKCCAELAACAADSTCVSCVTTSTPAAGCSSNPLVKAARTCVNGSCATACGGGGSGGAGGGTGAGGKAGSSAGGSAGVGAGTAAGGAGGASSGGGTAGAGATTGGGAAGAGATGAGATTGGGNTSGGGTGDPGTNPAGGGSDDSSSSGGCAVAAPTGAGSLAPFALLGLAALARGRRRRG